MIGIEPRCNTLLDTQHYVITQLIKSSPLPFALGRLLAITGK